MTENELNNCDLEPIHVPGKIQSHGFLLVIDKDYNITHASENSAIFLSIPVNDILGKPIDLMDSILEKEVGIYFIKSIIEASRNHKGFEPHNPFSVRINKEDWLMIIHPSELGYIIDFEREEADLTVDVQQILGRSLSQILSNKNLDDILLNSARQIREIIQYDRVMVYRFHDDGHGEVVAESRKESLESWLGLHYPASDIPKQARDLYKVNLTRLIADVDREPAAIWSLTKEPLDLTLSTLRAVSPIHIQYLKNMGVASSFSVSVICGDELWGLIACHNYTPRFINFKQRESAKLLGQVLSSAIDLRQQEARQVVAQQHQRALELLTRYLSRNLTIKESLFHQEITLQDVIESSGAVMLLENQFYKIGNVPDDKFLKALCVWLSGHMDIDVFSTDSLSKVYPEAVGYEGIASGILACRLARNLNEFIIWFRPEMTAVVNWAGNPEKIKEVDEAGLPFISPRKSFEIWSEMVKYTSAIWEASDRNCASLLRDEINYSINRKAIELRALNEKLMDAYAELDTFAYTISHDLKNPLTAIKGYAQLLSGSEELHLQHRQMGQSIEKSVEKMGGMIEEILAYSKVGQFKLEPKEIDMQQLMEEIKTESTLANVNPNMVIDIQGIINLHGDRTMMLQLFTNLISNAIKYSGNNDEPCIIVSAEEHPDHITYKVVDNGIGIKKEDHDKIFDLFSRSSNAVRFSGSGVGLAIVKRIVEKHSGKVWLESEEGKGSTFYVKFKSQLNDSEKQA